MAEGNTARGEKNCPSSTPQEREGGREGRRGGEREGREGGRGREREGKRERERERERVITCYFYINLHDY